MEINHCFYLFYVYLIHEIALIDKKKIIQLQLQLVPTVDLNILKQ